MTYAPLFGSDHTAAGYDRDRTGAPPARRRAPVVSAWLAAALCLPALLGGCDRGTPDGAADSARAPAASASSLPGAAASAGHSGVAPSDSSPAGGGVAIGGVAGSPTGGSADASGSLTRDERGFIITAVGGGLHEVAVSKLAVERGSDPAVRAYASMLASDHAAAHEELLRIARERGLTPPERMPATQEAAIHALGRSEGAAFDRRFVQTVGIEQHRRTIAMFERARRQARDPALKAWLDKAIPTLRRHLAGAEGLRRTTGIAPGAPASGAS